jgi:DNA-binding MarR family transcriptional regulator
MVRILTNMDEIGLMGRIWRARKRTEGARLRAFGISLPQFSLIKLARQRGQVSLSEAAATLDWDRPTCTIVARRCVEEGWLRRRRDQEDRRSARLQLTGQGEELIDRVEGRRQAETAGFPPDPLDILGGDERALLHTWLERIARRADDLYGPDVWPGQAS